VWILVHRVGSPSELEPPSAVVAAYVHDHDADLDEFTAWVANHPAPQWPLHLKSADFAVPNLTDLLKFHRALVAAAMTRAAAHDVRGAEQLIETSWRLNESLHRNRF